MGAEEVITCLQEKLGIKPGETTPDQLFTLETVECLAACHVAPLMMVNDVSIKSTWIKPSSMPSSMSAHMEQLRILTKSIDLPDSWTLKTSHAQEWLRGGRQSYQRVPAG